MQPSGGGTEMTKMYIDRAVVEKALEALKFSTPNPRSIDDDYTEQGWKEHIAANAALSTALAVHAEPVAWKQGNLVTFNEDPCPVLGGLFVQFWDGEEVAARVYANDLKALRQRCAKVNAAPSQQEPVAWLSALKDAFFEGFTSVATYNDTLLNSPEEAWEKYKPPNIAQPSNQCAETCVRAKLCATCAQALAQQAEPVAWMYKAEPWFDGHSWHETYETTMDKTLAYFKDKNARALCFVGVV